MNNLSNYDMFSRSLKEEKDAYEQRFTDKQDAANESTALLYEGLTAPFIEQSGMNLLKKGIKSGAKSLGLSDEVVNSVQSIGEDLKAGNWSEAGRKITNARKNPLFSPEQQKFLIEKQKGLNALRGADPTEGLPKPTAPSASSGKAVTAEDVNKRFAELSPENKQIAMERGKIKFKAGYGPQQQDYEGQMKIIDDITNSGGGSAFEELSASLPKFAPAVPKVVVPELADTSDLLALPKVSLADASTGRAIKPVKQIVKPTQSAVVKDFDGKILTDTNEVERQNLEERIAKGTDNEGELRTLQGRLKKMIGQTAAPEELSPQARAKQSLDSFLKKYKKVQPEDTNITPTSASKPLVNPRDFAPDIEVPEGSSYARGLNGYKVDARNIKSTPSAAPAPEVEAPPAPSAPAPSAPKIEETPGVPAPEVDKIIGQEVTPTKEQLDTLARADKGDYTVKNPTRSAELKDTYSKLSDNGQKIYADKVEKGGLDRYDYDGRQKLLQQADVEDKAQISQSQAQTKPQTAEVPDSSSSKPPIAEPDAPPVEDKPGVVEDFGKAFEKGATIDAELGGPEDVAGDVVAAAISVGTLLFGLNSAHKNDAPPPIKQINPTLQYGTGQI